MRSRILKRYKIYMKKPLSQPEDGFGEKGETCSCNDVLIVF
jgi:hypothetical protein